MTLQQDWNEELVLQFYAIVQFEDASDKSFQWMTNGKVFKSNIYEFAKMLNIPANRNPDYETVHPKHKMPKKTWHAYLMSTYAQI